MGRVPTTHHNILANVKEEATPKCASTLYWVSGHRDGCHLIVNGIRIFFVEICWLSVKAASISLPGTSEELDREFVYCVLKWSSPLTVSMLRYLRSVLFID